MHTEHWQKKNVTGHYKRIQEIMRKAYKTYGERAENYDNITYTQVTQ